MEFILHKDFSSFNAGEWNALLTESITDVPFLRFEYLTKWWQTRGGGEWAEPELVLVSASENGRLIGIAPLFLAEHEGTTALMLVGSIQISDYLDLIVRAEDLSRFLTGLLDLLASSNAVSWSALDWYNLPDASPTLAALRAESERRAWVHMQEVFHPTPVIPFNGGYEAYLATLEKKQRHEMRRKVRRAEERGARWYVVAEGADIEAEIAALLKLMEDDQAKAEFLRPAMNEQMSQAIRAAHENGWLWLAFLEIEGVKAAAALNFDYRNRLLGYNSGVDHRFLELSPGWVLLAYSLQWAAENGRAEFDFMRGNEEYKYRFGAVNRYVMRVKVTRGP
jgi:CelD/BcsL family acetyltransferase involved in cellulose biosynthesis